MAKTVFDKILDTTTGPKSFDWYRKQVNNMTTPGAKSLISRGKATRRPKYGVMNLFGYDAKHKAKLDYYDKFPLILPLEPAPGGFRGINFHYLPFGARVESTVEGISISTIGFFDQPYCIASVKA